MSLRWRIVSLAVGAALAALILFLVPLLVLEQRSAAQEVEQTAVEAARAVADYVSASGEPDADIAAYVERVNGREDAAPVAVVLPDGTRYGVSLPAFADPGPDDDGDDGDGDRDGPFLRQSGVDVDSVEGGRLIRVDVRSAGGPTRVLAFASDDEVRSTVARQALPLAGAVIVLLVVVAVAADVVSRRLVRDLARTADLADTIAAGDIFEQVPEQGPPEVRRVAQALNGLAGRIEELLRSERETAADLSHRLRTPLTALRLDVESLPDGFARELLGQHVDVLERTLTEVIRQARRTSREGPRAGCLPGPVIAASVDYWRPLVEDQRRAFDVSLGKDLPEVHCAADDLRAALDALLENAVAHTPEGTPIAVHASGDAATGRVVVDVSDDGPGFASEAVRRGRSDRGSTGLGLDIARSCARASGGDLHVLRDDAGGVTRTVVRLSLGTLSQEAPSGI